MNKRYSKIISHAVKKTVLITAGPTIEPIDPVRYISNYSTGKMGCELARVARCRGYTVVLIHGPITATIPDGVKSIGVRTASEMRKAVIRNLIGVDYIIMAAAVSDFKPLVFSREKIKKDKPGAIRLKLKKNPDILKKLGLKKGKRVLIGFALETVRPKANAIRKLKTKNLDFIVLNTVKKNMTPFGTALTSVTILGKSGFTKEIKEASKARVAAQLFDIIDGYGR